MKYACAKVDEGMLHVYTGDGKGKTTSCIGLAIRSAGAGHNVLIIQFDKGPDSDTLYSERKVLKGIDKITLIPTGCNRREPDGTFRFGVDQNDIDEANRGLSEIRKGIRSGNFDLIVGDELITSASTGLIKKEDLKDVVSEWLESGRKCELILSGRNCDDWLMENADLVTEMKKIKHYFDKGTLARKGIEY
ncbi:cob(I)yrinic acid a,c-diamide adenosyltransferase [bacterium]|nr:cob(I)yrinic acid a,c-diamide adenosyltransferase [bacterium]MBU1025819.1 cob(I)yrinic acid a,c-diamide adenosyltransferase [bacterium]